MLLKLKLLIENKITENSKIAKDITNKILQDQKWIILLKKIIFNCQSVTLNNLNDNNIFSSGVIKRIFETMTKA